MPKIDFYVIPETELSARLQIVCRLIEKAYQQKHQVYVNTQTESDAHQLDELLWTYREDSFLPHNLYGEGPTPSPPIQIGFNVYPEKHRDILINLGDTVPEYFTQFARVMEVVIENSVVQELARERFRFYRAEGITINTHKLQTTEV